MRKRGTMDLERVNAALLSYPYFLLDREVGEDRDLSQYKEELTSAQANYVDYRFGAIFYPEGTAGKYVPSTIRFKIASQLINKEARFMFSQSPDINITGDENDKEQIESYKKIIDTMLTKSNFSKILLQAAKDCFITGRVACLVDMSEKQGLRVQFFSSLQFYHETDYNTDEITKFITIKDVTKKQHSKTKLYIVSKYIKTGDKVTCSVIVYDGSGVEQEVITPIHETDLKEIPAVVITNDGILSDEEGVSDMEDLISTESGYSRLANSDIDADRKGMNPIIYLIDVNSRHTKDLPTGPGAMWEFKHDQEIDDPKAAVGLIAPPMNHTEAVKTTLERIRSAMYGQLDIPDISEAGLLSGITSFKALKALYYPLSVRCNEKLKTWKPALETIIRAAIELAVLNNTTSKKLYVVPSLKLVEFDVDIVENYALLDDEEEEKATDLQEIAANTRSRYSYLKKWRGEELRTDDQVEEEILRIATEANMMDTLSMNTQVQTELDRTAIEEEVDANLDEEMDVL